MRRHRWAVAAIAASLFTLALGASAASADTLPTVTADPASKVGVTSALLAGNVNPNGAPGDGITSWRFEYRPQGSEEWWWANEGSLEEGASQEANPVGVETILAGLNAGESYEFRLLAFNAAGQAETAPQSFTMDDATVPVAATKPTTGIGYTVATLEGTVDPEGGNVNEIAEEVLPIEWQLFYAPEDEPESWSFAGNGTIEGAAAKGSDPVDVKVELGPGTLIPAKKYIVRLIAYYAPNAWPSVTSPEPYESFETDLASPPVATIDAITGVTGTSASFSGSVNPNAPGPNAGLSDDEKVAYETSWSYSCTPECPVGLGSGSLEASDSTISLAPNEVNGLQPNTQYTVTLTAKSKGGEDSAQEIFITTAIAPMAQTLPATSSSPSVAQLRGKVNPHNSPTTYWFEWGTTDCSANPCAATPVSKDADAGSGGFLKSVSRELTGLSPGVDYHYRLVAKNDVGTVFGPDRTFSTAAAPSGCANAGALGTDRLADCRAWEMVSPPEKNGGDVMADSGRSRAAADGSAISFASLSGFSDVRGFGIATEFLAKRTAAPGTNGWATHAITPPQDSLSLLGAFNVQHPFYVNEFSADLDTGLFRSWSPLAGTPAALDNHRNLYLRRDLRTPGAGTYRLISECPRCEETGTTLSGFPINKTQPAGFAADYSTVTFETSRTQLTTNAAPGIDNLYQWDEQARDETQALTVSADAGQFTLGFDGDATADLSFDATAGQVETALEALPSIGGGVTVTGGPGDASGSSPYMVTFGGTLAGANQKQLSIADGATPLSGGAGASVTTTLDGGHMRLAGRIPAGGTDCNDLTGPPCVTPPGGAVAPWGASAEWFTRRTLSADGSRAVVAVLDDSCFSTRCGPLYSRIDGVETLHVNASERTVPDSPRPAAFWSASTDGKRIFFTSEERLTDAEESGLYMWDATKPVGARLTLLSVDSEPKDRLEAGVYGVIDASEDGRYVYFLARGQLVEGEPIEAAGSRLYLWHDGELTHIGAGHQFTEWVGFSLKSGPFWLGGSSARVSPDGRHLVFQEIGSQLTGYPHSECAGNSGVCTEVYHYSADTDTLSCASCSVGGAEEKVGASVFLRYATGGAPTANHLNRVLTDNGRYVFFSTAEALVADDTNGVSDAYAYDTVKGTQSLLSTGTSSSPSFFLEASANGKDAFFLTRERLSGWDVDGGFDIYDARVGGGLPEPPPVSAPCVGDSCQPQAPTPPNEALPGSSTIVGPGSPREGTKCPRGKRKAKAKGGKVRCVPKKCPRGKRKAKAKGGKVRCVPKKGKKGSSKQKRNANKDRRAGR